MIHGDDSPKTAALAPLIRRLAPSTLPTGFFGIDDCSKPRLDAYGGGIVTVAAEACTFRNLDGRLAESLGAARG